jgi:hypothetical protein
MINEQVGHKLAGLRREAQLGHQVPSVGLSGSCQNFIGYQPNTLFEAGLDQAIAWFRDNWECIDAALFGLGVSSAVQQMVTPGKG